MFKQVKSALFWYYLYKFRRKVVLIAFLLLIAFFANAIYSDIVQYLTLKEKLEYLELVLIGKWFIIIFNILFSIYLLLTLFKKQEKNEKEKSVKSSEKKSKVSKEVLKKESKFTKREEEFLNKKLKSKADLLVER
jgi:predicted membrane protein